MNPTARNRYRFSCKHYKTHLIKYNNHLDAIFGIITSAANRQSKPMRENYMRKPSTVIQEENECPQHYSRSFGCFANNGNLLVAYSTIHISGQLCAITKIIG